MTKRFRELQVFIDNGATKYLVGTLASFEHKIMFEYESTWKAMGLELAPFKLPLRQGDFQFNLSELPYGLPGLFADSLPDGWGLLIMDRFFTKQGGDRYAIFALDRLAYLGDQAMGALTYQPSLQSEHTVEAIQIAEMAREAYKLFAGDIEEAGRLLAKIGGSPGGARPKALIGISDCGRNFVSGTSNLPAGYSHWLVKFSNPEYGIISDLGPHEGVVESVYLRMANLAGIDTSEFMLIPDKGMNHLAVRRFDRPTLNQRLHMATASGLLHADHRQPSLDYDILLKVAWGLTRNAAAVTQQYRRAIFNLMAANRDDHAKNHAYLLNREGKWLLSPAYDLTFCFGPGGEHSTAYLGTGKDPSLEVLLRLAGKASIGSKEAEAIIEQVDEAVAQFSGLCNQHGVPPGKIKHIVKEHNRIRKAIRD